MQQIDKVEKEFGSVRGDGDSGTSLRTFGTLLKWMSERTCSVFIIMTANEVSRLPPEFARKGRIDEIYGVYLSTEIEREEIFRIHLDLRGRCANALVTDELIEATEGYTGADIEQVVVTGLKLAFHAGRKLKAEHLVGAVPDVRPLSRTDPERVAAMTAWLEKHTKSAGGESNSHPSSSITGDRKRHVTIR